MLDGKPCDWLAGTVAWKQPLLRTGHFPVVAQYVQQPWREHHVTIFPTFARLYTNDHALTVNRGGLQPDRLGHTQPCRVANCQDHPLLQDFHRIQKSGDLLGAQHFGKLVRLPARGNVIRDGPCAPEGNGVEEP